MKVEDIKLAFANNQKFEFGLIDDIRQKIKLINDLSSKMEVELKKHQANKKAYDESLKVVNNTKNQYYNNTKDIVSISNKLDSLAKELGIDVKSIKEYNLLWDSVKNGNKITDIIDELDS